MLRTTVNIPPFIVQQYSGTCVSFLFANVFERSPHLFPGVYSFTNFRTGHENETEFNEQNRFKVLAMPREFMKVSFTVDVQIVIATIMIQNYANVV